MDNSDFVAHLADTTNALDASVKLVEAFVRSFYQAMHAVIGKWSGSQIRDDQFDQAFAEVNAVHQKYWLSGPRFIEYWQPSIGSPDEYLIVELGITIFSDMLGNFVEKVATPERTAVYILSVVRDERKIVNKLIR